MAKFTSPCLLPTPKKDLFTTACEIAETLLPKWVMHEHIRDVWRGEKGKRIRGCNFNKAGRQDQDVLVYRDTGTGRPFYKRLQTCASAWSCPICAPKIGVRRREQQRAIASWARSDELRIIMLTFTSVHTASDSLSALLDMQGSALRRLREGKRTLKKIIPYEHTVRSREVTHGVNGWHPHTHELLFTRSAVPVEEVRERVFALWRDMSVNAGLGTPTIAAFHLTDCDEDIAEYISKFGKEPNWTAAEEITLGYRKEARFGGCTPWGLLSRSRAGDVAARALWIEFSEAVKGQDMLRNSPGLLAAAGLVEQSDVELVEEAGEVERSWFANIPDSVWQLVRTRWRGHLLQVAALGDELAFFDYLCAVSQKERERRGLGGQLLAPGQV